MEEKERYSWYNHSTEEIYDNKDDIVFVGAITVLNQQNRRIWELIEENQQLKQQLAEKENEISNLNGLVRERDKQIKNLKTNKKRVIEHKNKTKISFAIEQLEKVKENAWQAATDISQLIDYTELGKIIDNQIKSLKGEE